jgi:hypothetical protein
MTATYVPIQADIRWSNTNYRDEPENPDDESRLGHFHFYNETWRRHIIDHFQLTGDETLLLEAKAQTYVQGAGEAFMIAVNPEFKGIDERCDPDGSAPLLGQGPTKLAKYWPEAKSHIISSLPQPLRGEESVVAVIGGDMLCLGPTNTPVANIGQMLADTHTFHPDHFAACRHAQLEDIRD